MKVLLIAQEPPLSHDRVVTGNSIRTRQLTRCLEQAGHEVAHIWQENPRSDSETTFTGRDDLRGLLMRQNADVHLVGYWELLDLMPFESDVPLILDFLAPRPLEQLFEDPHQLRQDLRRLQVDLSKVDLLLTGSEKQHALMLLPLLEAGLDLGRETGAVVVPLAAETIDKPRSNPKADGWKLVSGGVNWPWRNTEPYWKAIESMPEHGSDKLELILFGGGYALDGRHEASDHGKRKVRSLLPYEQFSEWLLEHGHIGLELADDNVERRFSQSFRSIEFLRHGLPVICNTYLSLARQIERYDAGWLIDNADDLPELLRAIMSDPSAWRAKSSNACRLAESLFSPAETCAPLLEWLKSPRKAARLPREIPAPPELGAPALKRRAGAIYQLGKRSLGARFPGARSRVLKAQRRVFGGHQDRGVVIVTRSDLFPADHGAAVKIVETARGLSRVGRDVALVTDDRRYWWRVNNGEVTRKRVPLWVRAISLPGFVSKALHYSKDIPGNNAFLYLPLTDGSYFWRTLYAARRVGARVLQAEFPAYVRPCIHASEVLDTRLALVEHNVEYERIRTQVAELTEEQYRRYKAIEIDLCNHCDAVICVSDNDRQKLAEDGVDLDRLYTVPHGVDLDQFDLPAEAGLRERFGIPEQAPLLVYHGTFSYPPNLRALEVYAQELLPRLEQAGLSCHVLAVGREPPEKSPHPHIHLTGSVDKVGPWIKAADLAVVPLLDGGGTRMKIIDCFAAGTAVVSTSKGIEGIPVINGKHALVIDDWDAMAAAIGQLLREPDRAQSLAVAARAMAATMDWKSIASEYVRIFDTLEGKSQG